MSDEASFRTIEVIGANVARIRKLEPGDVLLVQADDVLGQPQRGAIRLNFEEAFPGHRVVFLDGGKQLAIVRPDKRETALGESSDG